MLFKWRAFHDSLLKPPPRKLNRFLPTIILLLASTVISFLTFSFLGPEWVTPSLLLQLQRERLSSVVLSSHHQHYLSACVIVRESSDIMAEFLIRNFAAGIDHFFIYGDDDDEREVQRLETIFSVVDGLVTYIKDGRAAPHDEEDRDHYVQMRMYRHCLQEFGNSSKWVTLIDTDEFFETYSLAFPKADHPAMHRRAFLHDVLSSYESFPILCVRWKTALTNGRIRPLSSGQTLHDLFPGTCALRINNRDKLALRKTILQPRFLDLDRSPKLDVAIHKGFFFKGPMTNLHCKWGIGHDLEPPLYILHYWSRDLLTYLKKIRRGRPRKGVPARNLGDLFARESVCELEERPGSQNIRLPFYREYIKRMPQFQESDFQLPSVEQATGGPDYSSSNFTFCATRVARLIEELRNGKDFSGDAYCNGRQSPACTPQGVSRRHTWPFPWAEYLTNCGDESIEDHFFI